MRRRQFLCSALSAAGLPLVAQKRATRIEESDPRNAKLCHRIDTGNITDDDLRFLQQIGLKWVRLQFGSGGKIQLGQPGRDQDIETYAQFLRDLGRLGIPIASYDFHPANTYTTKMVQRRGYTAREFDLNDFRNAWRSSNSSASIRRTRSGPTTRIS